MKIPDNCYEFDLANGVCKLCNHGFYLFEGFCLECKVESGTVIFGLCLVEQLSGIVSDRLLYFRTAEG